jgi:PAS domain S-box-containing protein
MAAGGFQDPAPPEQVGRWRFPGGLLARRLIGAVILVSLAVTVFVAAARLYFDHRQNSAEMENLFADIQANQLVNITNSIWTLNPKHIQIQIDGIHYLPWIARVTVEAKGIGHWASGEPTNAPAERVFPLIHRDQGRDLEIGTLKLFVDRDRALGHLLSEMATLLAVTAIQIFIAAGFILLVFDRVVTRRLRLVTNYLRCMEPDKAEKPLRLPRGQTAQEDELDQAVAVINRMHENLFAAGDALRREKEQAEQYLAIAETIILSLDRDGTILRLNRRGCQILGYEAKEILGRNWFETVIVKEDRATVRSAHRQVMSREIENIRYFENDVETRSGERRFISWHNTQITGEDGSVLGSLSSGHDITERKAVEEELRLAKEEADLANRTKTEFLANMSHELRTPLNSVIGFSDLMMHQIFGPLGQPLYVDYAKDINESGKHLLDLIVDILDVSRIETGNLSLHENVVDVGRMIDSCRRLVRERCQANELSLEVGMPESVLALFADERRVKQILINLLSNAIKFTPPGGTINLGSHLDDDGRIVFKVADTGIGIAAEDLREALSTFGQVDGAMTRSHDGTGLGLPLSKKLAELHGATLTLTSEPGQGTNVTVQFPAERTHAAI